MTSNRGSGAPPGWSTDERGVVIVYVVLAIFVILGMAAFVIDLGYWYFQASRVQRAADAAALAGVTYMPGDVPDATTVAKNVAQANGFSAPDDDVQVSTVAGQPDQLSVSIRDPDVPAFFARVFGLDFVSETRTATAQYDPPIPLGSPENSLGTGDLSCTGPGATCENEANFWLAISGYCTAREDGDEYMTAYDGNHAPSGTICPVDAQAPTTTFANVDYDPTGYVYDIDDPPEPGTTTTADDVTVEIYDPAYNPPPDGSCDGAPGSDAGDASLAPCGQTTSITTNWLLYAPSSGPFDPSTDAVLAPIPGESRSDPGVFASGDPTCENQWCSLYIIPAGSPAGNYRLNLWTSADEPYSTGTNQFSLRALVGDGPPPCGQTCTSTSVDDSGDFVPCSTISENGRPADPLCPEIEGDTSMSIYVNAPGTAQCTTAAPRLEQASVGGPITSVTSPEPCATFYLAHVNPDYAGKTMTVTLFDPGEGATAIEIVQPDGQLAQFTYQTVDTPAEDGPDSGAAYVSDDGNDPPTGLVNCICNTGLKPGPLAGRSSPSQYNDRYLEIQTTLPSPSVLAQNGGWYRVVYVFNGASVSDRTTWDVSIGGNPIHLVP